MNSLQKALLLNVKLLVTQLSIKETQKDIVEQIKILINEIEAQEGMSEEQTVE